MTDYPNPDKSGVFQFQEDDKAYLSWLREHRDGFVLTSSRSLSPTHTKIHRATCRVMLEPTGAAQPGGFTERSYIKVYGPSVAALKAWVAKRRPESPAKLCNCPDR